MLSGARKTLGQRKKESDENVTHPLEMSRQLNEKRGPASGSSPAEGIETRRRTARRGRRLQKINEGAKVLSGD